MASPTSPQTEAEKFAYLKSIMRTNNTYKTIARDIPTMITALGMLTAGCAGSIAMTEQVDNNILKVIIELAGITGSALGTLYTSYHLYCALDTYLNKYLIKSQLKQAIEAFEKHPEFFPPQAHPILHKAKQNFATMNAQMIEQVYFTLCYLGEPTFNLGLFNFFGSKKSTEQHKPNTATEDQAPRGPFLGFGMFP